MCCGQSCERHAVELSFSPEVLPAFGQIESGGQTQCQETLVPVEICQYEWIHYAGFER